ncbi:cdc42 effector protein 4 [Protopterus annectens]|uniref:cdc42 effector protein 4 n=1 Tax=Protopterus annectens TaxID=7888 RepID=UPI001CFA8C8F|nr:cdc42 effector protein 4 [Protopterus annectens]XP_043941063.1 cdc42 effector protein 4 [Protopterus annectens]XP_043941064.1 cdc42 effector protein 4 [Protopterus annectens]XP_043941065.1 cdc42 effector protein 4 [Protopterus annectens]
MPILKQLVSGSSTKRRSRADLTAEMISAPMGDFRHTMHVGRGGDAFGDTSFLSSDGSLRKAEETSSKPGLLSRTFRSSKRSHSVTRYDKRDTLEVSRDSMIFVKNAVSLPQLNDKEDERSIGRVPKSLSSSPVKTISSEKSGDVHVNGGASCNVSDKDLEAFKDERDFGDITDLPEPMPKGGMKHAESIMSFHVDLGPSMLGDILSIMDKMTWDDDLELGPDDGKQAKETPGKRYQGTELETKSVVAPHVIREEAQSVATYSPDSSRSHGSHMTHDSSSISSSTSGNVEEWGHTSESLDRKYKGQMKGVPGNRKDKDFSFMDEDDDEITV